MTASHGFQVYGMGWDGMVYMVAAEIITQQEYPQIQINEKAY